MVGGNGERGGKRFQNRDCHKRNKEEIVIYPKPPFLFEKGIRLVEERFDGKSVYSSAYHDGKFYLVVNRGNRIIPVVIRGVNNLLRITPLVEIVSQTEKEAIDKAVRWVLDTDSDLTLFYNSIAEDSVLVDVINRLKGLRCPSTQTLFEAFIRAFIEQQLSFNISRKIAKRLIQSFGSYLDVHNTRFYSFPGPEALRKADERILRKCGLSRNKIAYIKNFSDLVTNGDVDLEKLWSLDRNNIWEELGRIKGIGRWTIEYVMVRGMRRYDVTPSCDLFLRRVISHYYCNNTRITESESRAICDRWGKWKGLASFYLIADYLSGGLR